MLPRGLLTPLARTTLLLQVIGSPHEHVNLITTDAAGVRRLEFFLRDKATKERVPWPAPKHVAHGGILKVLKAAEGV